MPFQVTFAQKAIPSGIIQFVYAGPDENAICDLSFSLEASVVGDLNGHTVLWEQIAGNPVTFTTPLNQLAISYNQTTFEDKAFRFWIDKGTASQRFDDVTVFGSPTSIVDRDKSMYPTRSLVNTTTSFDGDAMSIIILPPLPTTPHNGFSVSHVYTTASLLWDGPPSTNLVVVGYVIRQRTVSGTWADVATLPATAREYSGVVIGNMYQVDVLYQYPNSYIGRTSSNVILADGELHDEKIIGVDSAFRTYGTIGRGITIPTFDVETLVVVKKDYIDINERGYSISAQNITEWDVDVLSVVTKSYDDPLSDKGYTISRQVIDNYDVTVLIGGQVGGS